VSRSDMRPGAHGSDKGDPLPPVFCKDVIRLELSGGGVRKM